MSDFGTVVSHHHTSASSLENRPTGTATKIDSKLTLAMGDHTCCVGTLRYMAPEVVSTSFYGQSCDVFSFGCVLWEILHRRRLFGVHSSKEAARRLVNGQRPDVVLPSQLNSIRELVASCWQGDSLRRPSADRVCKVCHGSTRSLAHCIDVSVK